MIYQYNATNIQGKVISMESFKGKTLLIVNTASKCGFTPQYQGLEKLYQAYKAQGLEILAFPCDQFLQQEFEKEEEIQAFCDNNYPISFPLFQKIKVNGPNTHPLYQYLKKALPGILGERILWNFTKFLVDANGNPMKRFGPMVTPQALEKFVKP